ncbi:hypothetical protein GCM10023215_21230 [Pseudonocardia yuanmonensis]|uniref:Uncharacterized protein n=1 Tax=Pseudonocardia yuanmonensis TaxID=1095914 RepID=A0ABP8WDV1_9PSEU
MPHDRARAPARPGPGDGSGRRGDAARRRRLNDAGFWLVKEYFGLTVGQTVKSWSVMETIVSVVGLLLVLLISVFV